MRRSRLKAGFAGFALLLACQPAGLGAQSAGEAQVKAAYLFKLASFVRWPPTAGGDNFRICIVGRPDIARVLGPAIASQRVEGRPVSLAQLTGTNPQQARDCQILYLGSAGEVSRSLMAASRGAPVLTVTDRAGGTRGGAVEFLLQDGKVRFFINRGEAESRDLELSSRLLDVAAGVGP